MTLVTRPLLFILVIYNVQNIHCQQQSGPNKAINSALNNIVQQQLLQKKAGPNIISSNNQTSNNVPNSNLPQQSSNTQRTSANIQQQSSNVQQQNSNVQQQSLNTQRISSNIQQPYSNIQQKSPNLQQTGSDIQQQKFNIQQPNSYNQASSSIIQQPSPTVQQTSSNLQKQWMNELQPSLNTQQLFANNIPTQYFSVQPCQNTDNILAVLNSNGNSQTSQNRVGKEVFPSNAVFASDLLNFDPNSCGVKGALNKPILVRGNINDIVSASNSPSTVNAQALNSVSNELMSELLSNFIANNPGQIQALLNLQNSVPPNTGTLPQNTVTLSPNTLTSQQNSVILPQSFANLPQNTATLPQNLIALQNTKPCANQQQQLDIFNLEQLQSLQNQLRVNDVQNQLMPYIIASQTPAFSSQLISTANSPCNQGLLNSNSNPSSNFIQNTPSNSVQIPTYNAVQNLPSNIIQNPPSNCLDNNREGFQPVGEPGYPNIQNQQSYSPQSLPFNNQQSISSALLSYLMQNEGPNLGYGPPGLPGQNNNAPKSKSSLKSLVPLLINLLNERGDCGPNHSYNNNGGNNGFNMNSQPFDPSAPINLSNQPSNQIQAPPVFLNSNDIKEHSGFEKSRGFRESQKSQRIQEYDDSSEDYTSEEEDEYSRDYYD